MKYTSNTKSPTTAQRLHLHSRLLATTHTFFQARNVREVITPCFVSQHTAEPDIESFSVDDKQHWLRDSPEYEMKRILMTAATDIYQIAPVFRKGEHGNNHRPEFIMLEWYRLGWNYRRLMEECLNYLHTMLGYPDIEIYELSYKQLFMENFDCDPFACDHEILIKTASNAGYQSRAKNRAECLDFLFASATKLYSRDERPNTLVAIYDFPLEQSSFARISSRDIAERFEIFLNGIELANGYGELTQTTDYYDRIQLHNTIWKTQLTKPISIDEDFMQALKKYGLAECAGVAVGIERLLMGIVQVEDIAQVRLL